MKQPLFEPNMNLSIFHPYHIQCNDCCGLCCVALYFSKSEGFPENKNTGIPCKNLRTDYKCCIHAELSKQKLKGCMAYDCFGAGQKVSRLISKKPDWNSMPLKEKDMIFNSYLTVMQIHQTQWYLTQASILNLDKSEKEAIRASLAEGNRLASQTLQVLQNLDITPYQERANKILREICTSMSTGGCENRKKELTQNYIGKNMQKKKLTGADFSMTCMIAANLEQANLFGANFLGADLRDTIIKNTDLSQCLFLTQIQINAAKGNQHTLLPTFLSKPSSWEH